MKPIMLSKNLIDSYRRIKVDISYALSELLGSVDYDYSSQISSLPITQRETIEIQIDDAAYSELRDKFDELNSYDEVAELLLWFNYFVGGRL